MNNENSLKILSAEIVNFKNLKQKEVEIDGKSIMVIGSNGEGKSSFLQGVFGPFMSSYIPLKPVMKGEERGSCIVKIGGELHGEYTEYTAEMYFSPEHQKGRLVLLDKDGSQVKGPKNALESIIGDISFDVSKFLALAKTDSGSISSAGVKKQIEMLKRFMPKEVQNDLMQCDIDAKEITNKRKELNAEIKLLKARIEHNFSDEELEMYEDRKSMKEIRAKMSKVGETIENWNKAIVQKKHLKEKLDLHEENGNLLHVQNNEKQIIESCIEELSNIGITNEFTHLSIKYIEELTSKVNDSQTSLDLIPSLVSSLKKVDAWLLKNPEKPSMDALLKEQGEIQEFNQKCDEITKLKEQHTEIRSKEAESKKLSEQIKGFATKKTKIFNDHPLPVKGLTFDENTILYKGLPLNFEQHPTSTIIAIGVKIAMAMNPNLKIIIIKDGSLLDKDLYNKILKMVEKEGFQLFIEMVNWEKSDMEVRFAEKKV